MYISSNNLNTDTDDFLLFIRILIVSDIVEKMGINGTLNLNNPDMFYRARMVLEI